LSESCESRRSSAAAVNPAQKANPLSITIPCPSFSYSLLIVNGRSEKAVAEAKEQIDQTMPGAMIEGFVDDLPQRRRQKRCSSGSRSWTFS
jgi:hypothetical protein